MHFSNSKKQGIFEAQYLQQNLSIFKIFFKNNIYILFISKSNYHCTVLKVGIIRYICN